MNRVTTLVLRPLIASLSLLMTEAIHAASQPKNANTNPAFLTVWNNNIENLPENAGPCPGDWKDLYFHMKVSGQTPDIFIVQQVSDRFQLDRLIAFMNKTLPGTFAGVMANEFPQKPQHSKCGMAKYYQTNAIIYRTGRLDPSGDKLTWQSYVINNRKACVLNNQERTVNVMQTFYDKRAEKYVTVASIHFPTDNYVPASQQDALPEDPACARRNITEASNRLKERNASLQILGGDTNEPDRHRQTGTFQPWYQKANGAIGGSLGLRDPIHQLCSGKTTCLNTHWTLDSQRTRIDVLMARKGNGGMPQTSAAGTIEFAAAGQSGKAVTGNDNGALDYSDHRAIRANIHY